MAHPRGRAPRLSLTRAGDCVPAVRDGTEPPEVLADLTEEVGAHPQPSIGTVRPGRR
ncbi:hypothetical protein ACFV0O_22065 [Kitasatospora sp. NPDC059577]|uniref:hypothetical protein n=1 Tax=unclassified Kitasatospora TaxID=2633591 RepID=UPI0036C0B9A8